MTKILILSHGTARAIHRAPHSRFIRRAGGPFGKCELVGEAPTRFDMGRIRSKLYRLGIPESRLSTLEFVAHGQEQRRKLKDAIIHTRARAIPAEDLIDLGDGIYTVSPRLCALQAATQMRLEELVEYCYELCGWYALPLNPADPYTVRAPVTSVEELAGYLEGQQRLSGLRLARQAVKYVRDGSRSPMETAIMLPLVLPRNLGGLGIRGITMNHRVDIPERARALTRRSFLYFDIFIERVRLVIEYNGRYHENEYVEPIDEERKNALDSMGYQMVTFRRRTLFDPDAFRRVMTSIRRRVGISPARLPDNFRKLQEGLRKFILRRWLQGERTGTDAEPDLSRIDPDSSLDGDFDQTLELPSEMADFGEMEPSPSRDLEPLVATAAGVHPLPHRLGGRHDFDFSQLSDEERLERFMAPDNGA